MKEHLRQSASSAAASFLERERVRDEATAKDRRGRRGVPASSIDSDVIAQLAAKAEEQQRLLLTRLVSNDPTRKPRHAVSAHKDQRIHGEPNEVIAAPAPRHRHAPITIAEFDQKYSSTDPMLHYLINVIRDSKRVLRADIPRTQDVISKPRAIPEEDVLFLVYHRNPPCGFRNVYWLEFVPEHRAVNEETEYFTLSLHGLTHFQGSVVVEFADVDGWIGEKRAFDYMSNMPGLQKLQVLLFFSSWKKKAIRLKRTRIRHRVASNLFQCDPIAARVLIQIRASCSMIEDLDRIQYLLPGTAMQLVQVVQIYREQVQSSRAVIRSHVESACGLMYSEIQALKSRREEEIVSEKANYANVSRTTRLVERLYSFLRLVDLLIFESLSSHLNDFFASLHRQLCGAEGSASQRRDASGTDEFSIQRTILDVDGTEELRYTGNFRLLHRSFPTPFICATLVESIHPEVYPREPVSAMGVAPTKEEVFAALYGLLNEYLASVDGTTQLLGDLRFMDILAPYTPQNRQAFLSTLLRPSTQVLQQKAAILKDMRHAIDTYYKQLEIQLSDRSTLVEKVFAALQTEEQLQRQSKDSYTPDVARVLTAEQHENLHSVWGGLLDELKSIPRVVQIGVLLFDQSSLLERFQAFVTTRMQSMMDDLPYIYSQFLTDLLVAVDGRIDRVMKIPTSITEAITWIKDVMEMMSSHEFRRSFDLKCANLANLKRMLKASNISCRSLAEQEALKKKDLDWESTYETLIICLARVQEKESEHRRSVLELSNKADEYVSAQLDLVKADFNQLPLHHHELKLDKRRTVDLDKKKKDILARLERFVALEGDREEMLERYTVFAHEHRQLEDPDSSEGHEQIPLKFGANGERSLPSELLLEHVSVVVDMRSWFCAWVSIEEKWLDTPLPSVHASLVLSRIKQFRRRLVYASSRLLPPSTDEHDCFTHRDQELVTDLRGRVEKMASDYVIFQAVTSGAFGSDRWKTCCGLFLLEQQDPAQITLRMMKQEAESDVHAMREFTAVCERVLVEVKLRSQVERIRQRLSVCSLEATSSSYFVVIKNLEATQFELDDLRMSAQLVMQPLNPYLQVASVLARDIDAKLALCNALVTFQGQWEELIQLTRISDVDEFFTGQVAWKGPVQRQKKKAGRDESVWNDFVETARQWNERLRRLVCMCQASTDSTKLAPQGSGGSEVCSVTCSLDDALKAFHGFDFDSSVQKCERVSQLVSRYIKSLRDACPRLLSLSTHETIHLLVHEEDVASLRRALSRLYPHAPTFLIERTRKQGDPSAGDLGVGAIAINGWRDSQSVHQFAAPVVKVGRIKFWMSRLEEEMGGIVHENLKRAVDTALFWVEAPAMCSNFIDHLPQSIAASLNLSFTSSVQRALDGDATASVDGDDTDQSTLIRCQELRACYSGLLQSAVSNRISSSSVRGCEPGVESIIIILQYQVQVIDLIVSAEENQADGASSVWRTQLKIDFVVEDTATKATRRFSRCNRSEWQEILALGPSFPITFFARVSECEFPIGREYVGSRRAPVITPLTERCSFAIYRAMHSSTFAVINPSHQGGSRLRWIIRWIADTLMKPLDEITFESGSSSVDYTRVTDGLQFAAAAGSMLALYRVHLLTSTYFRIVVEHLQQLKRDVQSNLVQVSHGAVELRALPLLRPTAAVFVPCGQRTIDRIISTSKWLRPIAVTMPALPYYTRILLLLAGYQPDELSKLESVVQFFDAFASMCPSHSTSSSALYRFVAHVIDRVKGLRYSCRVLLPSSSKSALLHTRFKSDSRSKRRVATFFRRSLDGQDTADSVVHTLFSCVVCALYGAYLRRAMCGGPSFAEIHKLVITMFPGAQDCNVQEKAAKSSEDALWEAITMSLAHSNLASNSELQEKCMELATILSTDTSVIVLGCPGGGKTTCITTLHNAIEALAISGDDTSTDDSSPQKPTRTQLVYICSGFASFLLQSVPLLASLQPGAQRWLCIDGYVEEVGISKFEPGAEGHCLASLATRVFYETTSVDSASPSFVVRHRVLYIPRLVTPAHIMSSWHAMWEPRLPFPEDSKGAENVALVFRLTERLVNGCVLVFIKGEENAACGNESTALDDSAAAQDKSPTHFGMLSVLHLTQTSVRTIGALCFHHRAQLEDLTPAQVARMVVFGILWGFAGHVSDFYRHKLEQVVRAEVSQISELKRGPVDWTGDLNDSEHIGGGAIFWDRIQLPLHGVVSGLSSTTASTSARFVEDKNADRVIVISPGMLSLVRVARLLIQSTHSFLLVTSRGGGKSSLLRLLWLMNEKDREAETKIDASLDHRFAPMILNWQSKPNSWFEHPTDGLSVRCRAADEATLFAPPSRVDAARMVFVDDLAMEEKVSAMDEFVRGVVDHGSAINWSGRSVASINKAFGATLRRHKPMTTKSRLPGPFERLLRHFAVIHLPPMDRSQLQGVFRLVFHSFFDVPGENPQVRSSGGGRTGNSLPLPEIVLRAAVDLSFDTLTVQHTSEDHELVHGFTFNLHHLDAILRRTLPFAQRLAIPADASTSPEQNGATLLTLGKLQQCWCSATRDIYLLSCTHMMPTEPLSEARPDTAPVLAIDDVKKVTQSMKATSEKYFSATIREDPVATMRADIVFGVYSYLTAKSMLSPVDQVRLEELLTSSTSGSSGASGKRGRQSVNGSSLPTTLSRDERAVKTAQELLMDATSSAVSHEGAEHLLLQLHVSSTTGCHQLVQSLQALSSGASIIIDRPISRIQRSVLWRAFRIEEFEVFDCNDDHKIGSSLQEVWHEALFPVVTRGQRVLMWIDAQTLTDASLSFLHEAVQALCLGKEPPAFFTSHHLKAQATIACAQHHQTLELLTEDHVRAFVREQVRTNFRLCLLVDKESRQARQFEAVSQLARMSGTFQWVSFERIHVQAASGYRRQVLECALDELREADPHDDPEIDRNRYHLLLETCTSLFQPESLEAQHDEFLSFVVNTVKGVAGRADLLSKRISDCECLIGRLEDLNKRVPWLRDQACILGGRRAQLTQWLQELEEPVQQLQDERQGYERTLVEREDDLSGDETRALHRRITMLERKIWAHHAMMNEYDLAGCEAARIARELQEEADHWDHHTDIRAVAYTRCVAKRDALRSAARDPCWLLRDSLKTTKTLMQQQRGDGNDKPIVLDPNEGLVCELWRSRFPCIRHSDPDSLALRVLIAMDSIHDRIPVVVDPTGLMQYILVHIFSGLPWFVDGNGDHERREPAVTAIGGGGINGIVVQCDGSEKMWTKLREAAEKEVPALLVNVANADVPSIAAFVRRHCKQAPRYRGLSELTLAAYALQLKRDEAYKPKDTSVAQAGRRNSNAVDRSTIRAGVQELTSTATTTSSSSAGSRRSSLAGDQARQDSSSPRRASLVLAAGTGHVPRQRLGFLLYGVVQASVESSASQLFHHIRMEWLPSELDLFLRECYTRRYQKKLARDLLESRRMIGDGAHRVMLAENTVWQTVADPLCVCPELRQPFMLRLQALNATQNTFNSERTHTELQLKILMARQNEASSVSCAINRVLASAAEFVSTVHLSTPATYTRSYRFYEQVFDQAAASLIKSTGNQNSDSLAITHTHSIISAQILETIVDTLVSPAHHSIFWLLYAMSELRGNSVGVAKAWLVSDGLPAPVCHAPVDKATPKDESPAAIVTSTAKSSPTPEKPTRSATVMSGQSLVERLRRKVRVCTLLFEQIGRTTDATAAAHSTASRKLTPASMVAGSAPHAAADDAIDDLHKCFRRAARSVKAMWCQWKLAKEDQRDAVRHAISSLYGEAKRGGVVTTKHKQSDVIGSPSSTTRVLSLSDVASAVAGITLSAEGGLRGDESPIEDRVALAMLAKVYFPHLLQGVWIAAFPRDESVTVQSTAALLRLDVMEAEPPMALPATIDVAWRRNDLVHLPTRVLLYDPTNSHDTVEILLLCATSLATNPLRLFSIVDHHEYEARLRDTLTATITSKERFALEISNPTQFDWITSIVSQIINQHALLCVPEWYIVCDTATFESVSSHTLGFLHVHAIDSHKESIENHARLTSYLVNRAAGVSDVDAATMARRLIHRSVNPDGEQTPLSVAVGELVAQIKNVQSHSDKSQRRRLMQELTVEVAPPPNQTNSQRTSRDQDDVEAAVASARFLGELLLIPSAKRTLEASNISTWKDTYASIAKELDKTRQLIEAEAARRSDSATRSFPPWWSALVDLELQATCRLAMTVCDTILRPSEDTSMASGEQQADRALMARGLVPVDWLLDRVPGLSDQCYSNIASVAQVLVLVLSRMGFLIQRLSGDAPRSLELSLFDRPLQLVRSLVGSYASISKCDASRVCLRLEPASVVADDASTTTDSTTSRTPKNRHASRRSMQALDDPRAVIGTVNATGSCFTSTDNGVVSGVLVDGLVLAERCDGQIRLHSLPTCRLVCSPEPEPTATDAAAEKCEVPVSTLLSTSSFQHFPASFWGAAGPQDTSGDRVRLTPALIASHPALSRSQADGCCDLVLCIPVFTPDDDDSDG